MHWRPPSPVEQLLNGARPASLRYVFSLRILEAALHRQPVRLFQSCLRAGAIYIPDMGRMAGINHWLRRRGLGKG
jgi:hypothetical protein